MNINTIYVEITNQCNLNCQTCYNRSGLNRVCEEISAIQLDKIINLFQPYGLKRVLLSGGEPAVHAEIDSILELIEKYPNLSFGIVTNGTVHHQGLISFINTHKNIAVQVSLDGSCEEQNAKIRGKGRFDSTIRFIQKLDTQQVNIRLKMVISQNNFEDIEKFYKLAMSMNCTPEFAFISKQGNGSDTWDNKGLSSIQKSNILNLIRKLDDEFNLQTYLQVYDSICPFVLNDPSFSFCIKTNGNIQPCQMLYSDIFTVGNVFHLHPDDFEKKLNDILFLAQKRTQADYRCHSCILRDNCQKGCMASAYCLYNDPLADDGDCNLRRIQFISELKHSIF